DGDDGGRPGADERLRAVAARRARGGVGAGRAVGAIALARELEGRGEAARALRLEARLLEPRGRRARAQRQPGRAADADDEAEGRLAPAAEGGTARIGLLAEGLGEEPRAALRLGGELAVGRAPAAAARPEGRDGSELGR